MKYSLIVFLAGSTAALAQSPLPPGPGRDVLMRICSTCHGPENVVGMAKNREGWSTVVADMAAQGAEGTDAEFNQIVDYLVKNFPDKVNVNKGTAAQLQNVLGLSEKDAGAVIHWREQNGSFKSLADLEKVPGLDAKKIEAKKDNIEF